MLSGGDHTHTRPMQLMTPYQFDCLVLYYVIVRHTIIPVHESVTIVLLNVGGYVLWLYGVVIFSLPPPLQPLGSTLIQFFDM